MSRAWLMLAAGETRQHGGNDGYDDDPARCYHWNSTVPNHAQPAAGDAIVIWNKLEMLGVSMIERIDTIENVNFERKSCPHCRHSTIKRRKVKKPGWLCFHCKHEFDTPVTEMLLVRDYHTAHETAWVDLSGILDAAALRPLCMEPRSQHSIREINWEAFRKAVEKQDLPDPLHVLDQTKKHLKGGFKSVLVRARVGQNNFRTVLLKRFGHSCAISGPHPPWTLDAAHLYSYAIHGHHDEHGGLLLRKDIHRLFDLGLICIHPGSLSVDVHNALRQFDTYAAHHGRILSLRIPRRTREWLQLHWTMHRE